MPRALLVEDTSPEARTIFLEAGYKLDDPAYAAFVKLFAHKLTKLGDLKFMAEFIGVKHSTVSIWLSRSNTPAPIHSSIAAKNIAMASAYSEGATAKECARKLGVSRGSAMITIHRVRRKLGESVIPYKDKEFAERMTGNHYARRKTEQVEAEVLPLTLKG